MPAANWVKRTPGGFLIPIAILIILSIPPVSTYVYLGLRMEPLLRANSFLVQRLSIYCAGLFTGWGLVSSSFVVRSPPFLSSNVVSDTHDL